MAHLRDFEPVGGEVRAQVEFAYLITLEWEEYNPNVIGGVSNEITRMGEVKVEEGSDRIDLYHAVFTDAYNGAGIDLLNVKGHVRVKAIDIGPAKVGA